MPGPLHPFSESPFSHSHFHPGHQCGVELMLDGHDELEILISNTEKHNIYSRFPATKSFLLSNGFVPSFTRCWGRGTVRR